MKLICFVQDNRRFVLAIVVNILALLFSIYWLIDSNFLSNNSTIDLEPMVTSIALLGTLLGLNYVNDKLTRPDIRLKLSMAIAMSPLGEKMDGISIDIRNHSIQKLFINNFFVVLIGQSNIFAIVKNGFTREIIGKPTLEPGQSITIIIDKKTIKKSNLTEADVGDFTVRDQVGREYVSSVGEMASHVKALLNTT